MIKISQEIKIKLGDDEYILTLEEATDIYNQLKLIVDKPLVVDWPKLPQTPIENPWKRPTYPDAWYSSASSVKAGT
jgi:hypothetical protein